MKTLVVIFLALVAATGSSSAQDLIAVQNGGTPAFYTELPAAIEAAKDGDTIYIPGRTWNLGSDFKITKKLYIIGTGHNLASSQVGGVCKFVGNFYLLNEASNGSLTGVLISGTFGYYNSTVGGDIVNYSLSRCRINGTVNLYSGYSQCVFAENVFDGNFFGNNATDNIFSNNIFTRYVGDFSNNNMFKNNIMMCSSYVNAINFSLCFFENNIIFSGEYLGPFTDCLFNNNLFVDNVSFPLGTTNPGYNNIVNQAQSSIFVTQSGKTFNYAQDYHLQATCPGKNAGKDGTDIGIYGGAFPWKEGSIPFNPHFESFQIAPNTVNGNLNVNIKVEAQER